MTNNIYGSVNPFNPQMPLPNSYNSYSNNFQNTATTPNLMNVLNNMNQAPQPQPQPQTTPQQQPQQPQFDPTQYVTKEDYESLLNEKKQLQHKLDTELAQRVDIEFFKMEQEMLALPEGARLAQELDYQKNRFFDALWRTSEPGQGALIQYRENMQKLYDQYRVNANSQPISTAPQPEEETF